jgi:hypothetical protein
MRWWVSFIPLGHFHALHIPDPECYFHAIDHLPVHNLARLCHLTARSFMHGARDRAQPPLPPEATSLVIVSVIPQQ